MNLNNKCFLNFLALQYQVLNLLIIKSLDHLNLYRLINHNFKNEILNLFLNTLYHNKLPYMIKFTFSHSHFIETSFIY